MNPPHKDYQLLQFFLEELAYSLKHDHNTICKIYKACWNSQHLNGVV